AGTVFSWRAAGSLARSTAGREAGTNHRAIPATAAPSSAVGRCLSRMVFVGARGVSVHCHLPATPCGHALLPSTALPVPLHATSPRLGRFPRPARRAHLLDADCRMYRIRYRLSAHGLTRGHVDS